MPLRLLIILALLTQPILALWSTPRACFDEDTGRCIMAQAPADSPGCCGGCPEDEPLAETHKDGPSPWCGICQILCRAMNGSSQQPIAPGHRSSIPKPADHDSSSPAEPFWALRPRPAATWPSPLPERPAHAAVHRARLCVWVI